MLFRILCIVVLGLACATALAQELPKPPNIVLILADDLGWSDLGCYGADLHETPNLDRLASEGVRFTQAYAMSVCSPTRSTLLTGYHAARIPITIWAEGSKNSPANRSWVQAKSLHDLPHDRVTIATKLRQAGYATASIGKWHLGEASHFPETHGFDVSVAGNHWGATQSFFWPYRGTGRFGNEFRYVPNLEYGKPGEYLTDRLTDEAIRFIEHSKDHPFFLYLAHYAPHTPIEAPQSDTEYFESKIKPGMKHRNATYAAMIKRLDDGVGRIMQHLKQLQLDKNTIVIFTSDNGGYIGTDRRSGQSVPVTNNSPLRSGKGSLYEGGIRVPLIVRFPTATPENTVCTQPVALTDLATTLLKLGGTASKDLEGLDGLDLSGLLESPNLQLSRESLYFHYPHYYESTTPVGAIRSRQWKLLEYFEDNRVELYDLEKDPIESRNLADELPDEAKRLLAKLQQWRTDIKAEMPTRR
ncbi:MAG: sulfatase [Pirellula sp.]